MDKYSIKNIIGKGKFGTIYLGETKTNGELVAIKTEAINQQYRSIKHEVKMMNYLFRNKFEKIPLIYWYGNHDNLVCLVMTYYECSLENYLNTHIDTNDKNNIMLQCIDIFQYIHKHFVLHRDIKPHNFMIKENKIYLIDFGLATFYVDEDGEHKPNDFQNTIVGTPKYVSYYNHSGYTISRRDELISLGYMYMSFFGVLPWSNINIQQPINNDKHTMIDILHPANVERKKYKSLENLFINVKEPEYPSNICLTIINYMKYCYSLDYDEEPNYYAIKQIFIV
jgi:serine/threonine protein kinase